MEKLKYSLLFMISILAISNRWVSANDIDDERNRIYNSSYSGKYNNRIAFPIGGIGTGMYCLEGTGYISHMSVWHRPEVFHEPGMFAALYVKGVCNGAKVLEGPVSDWRKFGMPNYGTGGSMGSILGLPRFDTVEFEARFPFAKVSLTDKDIPVKVTILGWSPFIPGDPDNSSLPVGGLEYSLENTSKEVQETIFSYHARNFLSWGKGLDAIKTMPHGFILSQSGTETEPHLQGDFAIFTDQDSLKINYCWFRGGWFDSLTMVWNAIEAGLMPQCPAIEKGAPGASMFVPVTLMPGEKKTIRIYTAWYVPNSTLRLGEEPEDWNDNNVDSARLAVEKADKGNYKPWYSSRFTGVNEVIDYFLSHYKILRNQTERFTDSFYRSTLPPEVIEAVSANLSILKSPTVMRQYDGRLWTWEGCADNWGSCHGSCTHVWNYAQAIPHLFPSLERSLRHTEFEEGQDLKGHQVFRVNLPIRPTRHNFHSAADGQLGGIMKVYREWRISGENEFLISMYPKVKKSLDYCISTWDPRRVGSIEEPHHNTYDIEFWGPDGMHNSFYYGALSAFDPFGYAVVPYLTTYQENRLSVDTTQLPDNVDLEQTTQFVVPNRGAMVAARFNANIGYRVLVTVSDRNGKPLPFGALASNDETGQQSIVDEGGILYLSGISSKSQSWTVRWGNQADQQCQFAFSTPDSEPTTSVLQGTAQCH